MIRWRYIGIRIFVVVTILVLLRWTAGPVAHWMLVRSLETATGAKVEIASTELGLFPPRFHLIDVTIADPRKEMRNAIELDHVYLAIDGGALLRRRYEISNGRIRGIRIGTDRTESGRLEVAETAEPSPSDQPSLVESWANSLSDDAKSQADSFVDSLQTVAESKRIRDQWQTEYAELRSKAKKLEDDIRNLRGTVKGIDNPLRDLPALQDTLRQAEDLRRELTLVRQRLDTLPARVRGDLESLEVARRTDQQRVAAYLPPGFEGGSISELGPELLHSLVRDQVQTIRDYLESGRSIAEVTVTGPQAERCRGETIPMGLPHPAWLVRRCEIDGYLSVDSDEYNMLGIVENITSDTENMKGPLHARLRLEGPRVVRVDFERHYDQATPRDHLKIHWPSLDLPRKNMGESDRVALAIDGGTLELWVEIEARGDQIQGQLISKQTGTRLALQTKPELRNNIVVQSLNRKLDEITHVDVDARFAGTWKKMELSIQTNLTSQLSDSMKSVVAESMIAAKAKLANEVDEIYLEQSRELNGWLTQQQAEARQLLAGVDTAIDTMSKKVVSELSAPEAYLSRLRSGVGRALK